MGRPRDWGGAALDDKIRHQGHEPASSGFDPQEDRSPSDDEPLVGVDPAILKRFMDTVAYAELEGRKLPIMPQSIRRGFGEGEFGFRRLMSDPRYQKAKRRVQSQLNAAKNKKKKRTTGHK